MQPEIDQRQNEAASSSVRISRLKIENFKAFDHLEIEFPRPSTEDELDVTVLGSKNGLGKTSILECCALCMLNIVHPKEMISDLLSPNLDFPFRLMVRAGASLSNASADGQFDMTPFTIGVAVNENGVGLSRNDLPPHRQSPLQMSLLGQPAPAIKILQSISGFRNEPLVFPPLLFFHSHRRVTEGNINLGDMMNSNSNVHSETLSSSKPLSTLKIVLLKELMARSGLFEGVGEDEEHGLTLLNNLMREFAGGTVDKLRSARNGTVELRVQTENSQKSFSFDGLSSGQKEIIATLFLIWYATREQPSVVLIDEPELHLNPEWQRIFIRKLGEIAPKNQYIMATHSEEIMASVDERQRLLLESD